jgi:hypothetical protein
MSKWNVDKAVVSLEEYEFFKSLGCKRPSFQGRFIRVGIKCTKCQSYHESSFANVTARNQEFKTLCTKCAGSVNTSRRNALRDEDYYEDEEYRRKISDGVKLHYQKEGKRASEKRTQKRIENWEARGVTPDFSSKRSKTDGVRYDSYGEEVFVEWKIKEGYRVERCDLRIPYLWQGVRRMYLPDFFIAKDGKVTIIEVKCEFLKNFRTTQDKLLCRNLTTYNIEQVAEKAKTARKFCKERGFEFELITLDDSRFNLLYNRAKRKRSEGRKKNNN